jgi:phenylalanyl-tRNA synthetase beta chain
VAELSLTALGALPRAVPRYQPLPRFPAVQRDLAIVVPAGVLAGDVEAHLRAMQGAMGAAPHTICSSTLHEGIGSGRAAEPAFSLTYQAPDRTLTDREVNDLHATFVAEIRARGAEIGGA